jgi:hypothetical protein
MGCKHSSLDKVKPYEQEQFLLVLPRRYDHPRKVNPRDINVVIVKRKSIANTNEKAKQKHKK